MPVSADRKMSPDDSCLPTNQCDKWQSLISSLDQVTVKKERNRVLDQNWSIILKIWMCCLHTCRVRPPFLRFTKFKFRFADLPFSVFFRFLSKTVQTDQNLQFFWISKLKFENLGNFLQCSRNTSPGVNKQNGRSANISSHWRAEKGIQTAKVWRQKANKATFWKEK